jgi:vacuolar-type H+-ATPase subunit I/STV1
MHHRALSAGVLVFIFGFSTVRILDVGSAVELQRPNSYSLHGIRL